MANKHNVGFLALVNDAKTRVAEIDVEQYKAMVADGTPHLLVDVREDNEFAAGHVRGAVHLGKGIIERDVETQVPDKSAKLVLYCGGGFTLRWLPTICSRWVTRSQSAWMAVGAR